MAHDLQAPGIVLDLAPIREDGETESAVVAAPQAPGAHPYTCTLHRRTMRGLIVVGPPAGAAGAAR
jgi:plastocyanin